MLVTCFNQPLAVHIAGQLSDSDRIEALHFHGLCTRWAKQAGLDFERRADESDEDYYDHRAPNVLTEAADALDRTIDAVIVDEAQDFLSEWIDALELLLEDGDGVVFLFADENQAIYRRCFVGPPDFVRYRLTSNLRNTGSIHELLIRHFGERSKGKGPAGVRVSCRTWSTDRELRHEVSSLLTLLRENGVPGEAITVLTGHSTTSIRLTAEEGRIGAFRLCSKPSRPSDIHFASVHRFKGLESPVVILCEMEELRAETARGMWYTGSRARSALVLVVRDEDGSLADRSIDEVLELVIQPADERLSRTRSGDREVSADQLREPSRPLTSLWPRQMSSTLGSAVPSRTMAAEGRSPSGSAASVATRVRLLEHGYHAPVGTGETSGPTTRRAITDETAQPADLRYATDKELRCALADVRWLAGAMIGAGPSRPVISATYDRAASPRQQTVMRSSSWS